ncbi:glucose dehydrogenase [Rhizobium sp. BK176]|nr:glucose dehydrogenase [Rhizobium sp. BK181]MBB3539811.1 glucose dehydrogenase [Rhizobium sp. BK399]MCS3739180.1 glucose dehydrogenase [Rhizobium sp. BK661]MCS4090495.1 glucose dehydrogenase [Rhizobium sp. BK176]
MVAVDADCGRSISLISSVFPAPSGAIPEDRTAPTQPISDLTFSPPPLQEKDMWG